MAFSTGFRLLRYQLSLPVSPTRLHNLRHGISGLRFLSVTPSRPLRTVKARRGQDTAAAATEEGNGSVIVKDENGRDRKVVPAELHKEATKAYMAYAMSVLLGRALPDIRDGLKPDHRRILFAMHELGLSSRKPGKKCARVDVGGGTRAAMGEVV